MARARSIKPGFFINDELAEVEPLGRILFAGLWVIADKEGRIEDRPKKIKAEILPYDGCDVDALLNSLADHGFILRYEVAGKKCVQVINFVKHQNPHPKEAPSELPEPPKNLIPRKETEKQVKGREISRKEIKKNEKQVTNSAIPSFPSSSNPSLTSPIPLPNADALEGEVENSLEVKFNEFWDAYPRKVSKAEARKSFEKINPSKELHETMIRAVRVACQSQQWRKDGGQYIPYPSTWLNQKRWEDKIQDLSTGNPQDDIDRAIAYFQSQEEGENDERRNDFENY